MTDEELIERLRHYAQIAHAAAAWGFAGEGEVMSRAADRMEALVKERDEAIAALPAVTQPAPDAAAIREAALREATALIKPSLGPSGYGVVIAALHREADRILALITEKPHDRA